MKRIYKILAAFLLFLFIPISSAHATLPNLNYSDPWFTTKFIVSQSALPEGIIITANTNNWRYSTLDEEVLVNSTPEPFYIIGKDFMKGQHFAGSELPDGYEPRYKIVSNNLYQYNPDEKLYTKFGDNVIGATIDNLVYIDQVPNKNPQEDDRPANVQIPAPQQVNIYAYYKGQYIQTSGTLNYYLNDQYNPHAGAEGFPPVKADSKDSGFGINSPYMQRIISFIGIGIASIVLIVIFFLRKKRK